jgi:topoisomerase-4 subunit B
MDKTPHKEEHLAAYRECKTIREFYNKSFEASDVRKSIVTYKYKSNGTSFESQTKTKLGSTDIGSEPGMPSVCTFVNDFVKLN